MKRTIAVVCALMILVVAPAAGKTTPPDKEEVVYAHLASDGQVDRVFVVNAFPESSGDIVDHGDYRQVVNLTNADPVEQSDDRVEIARQSGDFYYQGDLASRDMPWRLEFSYRLDGRPISAEQLQGQDGELVMRVSVRRNPAIDPIFFDNYMLQIQVNFDTAHFSDVASEGATIAANGETRVVNLTSMPGKQTDFQITARARDAHLGQVQAVGLPFEMFMELPDMSRYTSDLVQLEAAIAQLTTGVGQFTSGVDQLGAGAGELASGASALAGGGQSVAGGFDQLAAGRNQFDAGLRAYNQGVQQFTAGLGGLSVGVQGFTDGIDQLVTGGSLLHTGLNQYSGAVDQYTGGVSQAAQGSQQLTDGISQLSEGLGRLTAQGKYADPNLVDSSEQILAALQALDAAVSLPLTDEQVAQLTAALQGFSQTMTELVNGLNQTDLDALLGLLDQALVDFDASVTEVEQIAATLQDSAGVTAALGIDVTDNPEAQTLLDFMAEQGRQLDAATARLRAVRAALSALSPLITGLRDSLAQLQGQFDTVVGIINELNSAIQQLTPEQLQQFSAGISLLSSNYALFHAGLVAYVDGVEQAYVGVSGDQGLLAGAQQLTGGLGQLATSGADLSAGADVLAAGAGSLNAGLVQLQSGAHEFAAQSGQITAAADRLAGGGNDLVAGHWQLTSGDQQFGSGLHQYADAVGSYAGGAWRFADGVGQLSSGGAQLAGGANSLRERTTGMGDQMSRQIDEAMAEFTPQDYDLVSFTSPKNTGIQRVQFVYLTDPQSEPVERAAPEEPEQRSWWQRIIDIFRR